MAVAQSGSGACPVTGALLGLSQWGSERIALVEAPLSHTGWKVLLIAAYLALLAWGPLLAAVTFGYFRRRCRD